MKYTRQTEFTSNEPRFWYLIDAQDMVLGRLSAKIVGILRGKHKPRYTPHANCGDGVIVVNAAKVHLTGKKRTQKIYYRHTGYPGGIKSKSAESILDGAYPERVLKSAVKNMMPKTRLAVAQLGFLKVYADDTHPHTAQKPIVLQFSNTKNRKHS